jgi:hypothetical protein
MQRVLLKLLRILRFVRDYIVGRAAERWSLFTAFLGRRMSELRRSGNRKPGTSRNPTAAETLLSGNRTSSYSASGSAVLREHVVAASTVPGRLASSQDDAGQSASLPPSPTTSISASLSAHQPHSLYGRNPTAGSSGSLSGWSAQSRASERLSIIVNSRELSHVPVDQPSRPPRGIYRSFGPGVDPSTSRGQLARSPSPNITHSGSRLALTTIHSHPHDADGGGSPVVSPSPSSTHGPLRLITNSNMWNRSSDSIKLSIQAPSTDSLQTALTEESMAIDPPHSTPSYPSMDHYEIASQHSTIASATSDFFLPEGRFLQTIHSDQLPRYYDNVTMQVDYYSMSTHSLHLMADPARKKSFFWNP